MTLCQVIWAIYSCKYLHKKIGGEFWKDSQIVNSGTFGISMVTCYIWKTRLWNVKENIISKYSILILRALVTRLFYYRETYVYIMQTLLFLL